MKDALIRLTTPNGPLYVRPSQIVAVFPAAGKRSDDKRVAKYNWIRLAGSESNTPILDDVNVIGKLVLDAEKS